MSQRKDIMRRLGIFAAMDTHALEALIARMKAIEERDSKTQKYRPGEKKLVKQATAQADALLAKLVPAMRANDAAAVRAILGQMDWALRMVLNADPQVKASILAVVTPKV